MGTSVEGVHALTFHDVDEIAHITLLDDQTATFVLQWVHTIDHGHDLVGFEVLHEIVVEQGFAQEVFGSTSDSSSAVFARSHSLTVRIC